MSDASLQAPVNGKLLKNLGSSWQRVRRDTDFGELLLRFANGCVVIPDVWWWLAFQVATTCCLDKVDTLH